MDDTSIFSATLGLSHPWHITTVHLASTEKRLDISVSYTARSGFICPHCGSLIHACRDASETWRHDDFFSYDTFLHATVPMLNCTDCGEVSVERPWARANSKFTQVNNSRAHC